LNEEIGERLKGLGFKIPAMLEIRDDHHIERTYSS
jgi:hypothetical protein